MKCPNCGQEFDGGRCPNCGHPAGSGKYKGCAVLIAIFAFLPFAFVGGCSLISLGSTVNDYRGLVVVVAAVASIVAVALAFLVAFLWKK